VLKRALEIEEVTDFYEFDEILEHVKYVSLIHVGEMESPQVPTGQAFYVMQITAAENLQGLAERFLTQYRDFVRIFGKEAQAALPAHGEQDMIMDLESGMQPPTGKLYPLSPDEPELLKEYLDEMLKKGKIHASKSIAGPSIFFANLAKRKLRIGVDYRGLNAITIKEKYPLPLMTTLMEQVGTSQIFSKLDLKLAFHLLCIAEGDEWKTLFKTRYGLYEYTVMPFGLANAPSVFQRHHNNFLVEKIDRGVVMYIDDILIYFKTEEEFIELVRWVLQKLTENNLCINIDKCLFHVPAVEFVSFQVGKQGIQMSHKKVEDIVNWPAPRNVKDVQMFIGFANFYRRFIQAFNSLTLPIQVLTHNGVMWNSSEQYEKAFVELKGKFTTAPILCHYHSER